MTMTIVGAGAIGGVIGAYLIECGEKVVFVDRDEKHVEAINTDGLIIELKNHSFKVKAKAYTVQDFLKTNRSVSTVILAVKAQHTKEAIKPFEPLMGKDSFVVSFQNGLCELEIAEVVGKERTVGCFVNLFADYLEPGKIAYGGVGSVYIGEVDGQISERISDLKNRLQCWGEAKVTTNIFGYLWSKLSYGAILTITASTNNEIADFFENVEFHKVLNAIGTEVLKVAEAENIIPEPFDNWKPELLYPRKERNQLEESYFEIANRLRSYTKTRTGIWRDLAVRKRKTEVSQQLGPVLKLAEKHGIEMPLTIKLTQIIQEIEKGERELSINNVKILQSSMDGTYCGEEFT